MLSLLIKMSRLLLLALVCILLGILIIIMSNIMIKPSYACYGKKYPWLNPVVKATIAICGIGSLIIAVSMFVIAIAP